MRGARGTRGLRSAVGQMMLGPLMAGIEDIYRTQKSNGEARVQSPDINNHLGKLLANRGSGSSETRPCHPCNFRPLVRSLLVRTSIGVTKLFFFFFGPLCITMQLFLTIAH